MELKGQLDRYFHELAGSDRFSGVVRVVKGDQPLYEGAFGLASRSWAVSNSMQTRFDTASITKLFTAVAVLQLIDQGLLTFESRAAELLDLADTAISPLANVYQLLTHSSGIGDDVEEEDGESYHDLWLGRANYWVRQSADFLPQFAYKQANFAPGDGVRYCNCGYVLLGLMLEKVTGLSYREYVRGHVFQPAGMNSSDFFHLDQVNPQVAEGCDPIADDAGNTLYWRKNMYSFPPVGSPDAGAHVTAADLDRFLRAVRDGALLSPEMSRAFFTPQLLYRQKEGWQMWYGFGLWFYLSETGEIVCCQKEGINAGVSGMIRYFPREDISVVILCNQESAAWEPVWEIHRLILASGFGAAA